MNQKGSCSTTAFSVYAAPNSINKVSEILSSTKMITFLMKDNQKLKIPTPVHQNIADCASTIFDGISLLEKQPEMQKFSNILFNLKTLKTSLQMNLNTKANCYTERVNVSKFIKKLECFIHTLYLKAKH